jgi:hypothetical protein
MSQARIARTGEKIPARRECKRPQSFSKINNFHFIPKQKSANEFKKGIFAA